MTKRAKSATLHRIENSKNRNKNKEKAVEEQPFLGLDAPFDIKVQLQGDASHPTAVTVVTQYARFTSNVQPSVSGQPERWSLLETRPAFEVAMVRHIHWQPHVVLMQKRRKQDDDLRTKVPGGYLWGDLKTYAPRKIEQDTGLRINFERCKEVKSVIGHSEIKTPIRLFYCFDWQKVSEPRDGVRLLEISLVSAIEMAGRGEIENDSSFSLLMWLWYIHTTGTF